MTIQDSNQYAPMNMKATIELIDLTELLPHTIASAVECLWLAGKQDGVPEIDNLKKARYYLKRTMGANYLFQTEPNEYGYHEVITTNYELIKCLTKCILRCNCHSYHKTLPYLFMSGVTGSAVVSKESIKSCLINIDNRINEIEKGEQKIK